MNPPARKHRVAIGVLAALALVTGFVAITATWVKRQALDTHNWTNTSSRVLADKKVQDAVGAYLVNELFTQVDVGAELRKTLPPEGEALAAPAAAGLRSVATRLAPQLLARPRVQDAWQKSNEAAHKQLLTILNGGNDNVSTKNGEVTLDLHNLVTDLASTLGLEEQLSSARNKVGDKVPAQAGELVIMKSDQLKTAQDVAKGVRHLSVAMTVISLFLFGLCVFLAQGWRRIALRRVGWSFVALGIAALLVRRAGGNQVVDGLVQAESIRPAVHDVWSIGTSLLYSIAVTMIVYGLFIVACAWIAGPTRSAVSVRRALAPAFRERPVLVYSVLAVAYLLLLLWGPVPAFRNILPVLLMAGLIVLGTELLRRQTAAEFPEAAAGDASQAMRGWVSTHVSRSAPAPAGDGGTAIADLERLAALHDTGVLTDAEFDSQKAVLLGKS